MSRALGVTAPRSADFLPLFLIFFTLRALNLSGVLTGLGSFVLPLKGMAGRGRISVLACWGEKCLLGDRWGGNWWWSGWYWEAALSNTASGCTYGLWGSRNKFIPPPPLVKWGWALLLNRRLDYKVLGKERSFWHSRNPPFWFFLEQVFLLSSL